MNFSNDDVNRQLVVGRPADNIVTLFRPNRPPLADAGDNLFVRRISSIALDGSASYDLDGDPLTFEWTQNGGIPVTLSGSDKDVS